MSIFNLFSEKQNGIGNANLAPSIIDMLQSLNVPQISQHTLSNGLKVLYVQNTSPVASIQCVFNVGFKDDGNLPGLSHLTEHMAFRGTKCRTTNDTWSKMIFEGKGYASTSYASTNFYCYTGVNDYSSAVKTMVDMFSNSTAENLEIEKKVVAIELNDNIDSGFVRLFNTIYSNTLGKNVYDYTLQKQTLPKITVDDVKNHMKKYYTPSNATLVISGNIGNKESLLKTLDSLTSKWGQTDPSKKSGQTVQQMLDSLKTTDKFDYKPGIYKESMNINSVHCSFMLKGSPLNKNNITNFVKNAILVNLLYKDELQGNTIDISRHQKGLTYVGFKTLYNLDTDHALWGLTTTTDKASAPEVVRTIAHYIKDFKNKITLKNVEEVITNVKSCIDDISLASLNTTIDDFKIAADLITTEEVQNYFDSSIASKCTIGFTGGFDDASINDALYAEVSDILIGKVDIQPQDFI